MSEPSVTLEEEEAEAASGRSEADGGTLHRPLNLHCNDAPQPDQLGLNLQLPLTTPDASPSPSNGGTGLLSLPWEMVARIASHLPAQCVIDVLPQVCRALGEVGEDRSAWQLRAHRLTGARASFPVGPRDDFDWPTACLEMEQLLTCWAGQEERARREQQADEDRVAERDMEELGDEGLGAEIEGGEADEGMERAVEEAAAGRQPEEVAPDGEEMMLDDGRRVQPQGGGAQAERGEGEEREDAAVVREGRERGERRLLDTAGAEERAPAPERDGDGDPEERGREEDSDPALPPSPPLALERLTLPSGHIADVNSVLLVGGEGAVCASGSRDRNVNLWDLREGSRGTLLRTLGGRGLFSTHRGWVWCLAACGPLLASGSFDSTVRLWDLGAGGAERGLIRGRAAVLCLACQTDVLLAGSHDQKVSIYDTRVAEPLIKSLRLHGDAVLCLAADDQYILSGSKDHTVAVFDRRAGKRLQKLELSSYLLSMSYSEREVWAGDNKGLLHAFSMQRGSFKALSQFDVGHTSLVTGIHRSPGTLYTCSSDRTIKVHLPCAPPRTLCTLHHPAGVNGLSVEAGVLAIASGDMCVEVWRPRQ